MMMKDKLYKSNHKAAYYRGRKIGLCSIVVLSGFLSISIPTYINMHSQQAAKAEVVKDKPSIKMFSVLDDADIVAPTKDQIR